MPISSLPVEMRDTPPVQHCPQLQLGDGRTPLLGKRMCLRPVAFQGCGEASGHSWGWRGGHLRGSGRSVRDCLDLSRLELSRHKIPFSRKGKGGQGKGR